MINFKPDRYAKYKQGHNYSLEVPAHWMLHKLSQSFALIGSGTTPRAGENKYYDDGTISWINTGDLNDGMLTSSKNKITTLALSDHSLRIYPTNSLVVAMYGATIGRVSLTQFESCTNQACCVLSKSKVFYEKFLLYWFVAEREYLISHSYGAGQPNISQETIKNLRIFAPSIIEQQAIADYLDAKTKQIDRKIELLEAKAEKYANLKQVLINETVIRGLDKTIPMKDSGVEWIGQIPSHWEVKRVNDIATQQKIKNTGLREKNLLSLSYGKLKRKDIETSFGLLPESFETYQIVNQGNVILRLTDLQNDWTSLRVGLARERGIITSAYLCLRFSKLIHPVFAYYVLHTYDLQKVFYWLGSGLRSVMKFDDIKVLPFILPPLEEQKAIADYLEAKTAHIEKILETIHLEIEKLKELRKTLINDVVTGKIKVTGRP